MIQFYNAHFLYQIACILMVECLIFTHFVSSTGIYVCLASPSFGNSIPALPGGALRLARRLFLCMGDPGPSGELPPADAGGVMRALDARRPERRGSGDPAGLHSVLRLTGDCTEADTRILGLLQDATSASEERLEREGSIGSAPSCAWGPFLPCGDTQRGTVAALDRRPLVGDAQAALASIGERGALGSPSSLADERLSTPGACKADSRREGPGSVDCRRLLASIEVRRSTAEVGEAKSCLTDCASADEHLFAVSTVSRLSPPACAGLSVESRRAAISTDARRTMAPTDSLLAGSAGRAPSPGGA
jgi:hypothetical protein